MIRLLIAIFSICHGLVHGIMFALPYSAQARADMTFNPSDSWLIGGHGRLGLPSLSRSCSRSPWLVPPTSGVPAGGPR